MAGQGVSFLDEVRQVPQLAKLHDQMYMCRCFLAVYQRHDVGMMKAFQNVNLGVKVFLQLFVELVQVDGFDGDVARLLGVCGFVDGSKASASNLLQSPEAAD